METQGLDQSEVSDLNSIHNLKYTDGLNVKRSGITQNTENETCHVPSTQKWSKYGEKTWDLPSSRKFQIRIVMSFGMHQKIKCIHGILR